MTGDMPLRSEVNSLSPGAEEGNDVQEARYGWGVIELRGIVRQIDAPDAGLTAGGDIQETVTHPQSVLGRTVQPVESYQDQVRGRLQVAVIAAEGHVEGEVVVREDIAHRSAVVVCDDGCL